MAATDGFLGYQARLEDPARSAAAITPADGADISNVTRGLYIGGGGDVVVNMADTGSTIKFAGVPAGTVLPIRVSRVYSTNTTATSIVALW